ncbi:MAG TPA: GAF domain-containing protein, partial [Rubrobacter sp.]|nr:GAF domain-containing protein [Rubrobacter sp.]
MNANEVEGSGDPNGERQVSSLMATQLSELARELQQENDLDAVLAGIVQAALELIPGTAHASISLVTGRKKVNSEVASGELPRQVDALQNSTGQGPCLDAAYQERVVRVPDLSRETRWPDFSRGAMELGARSMLSFQLFVEGDRLGALNLYGDGPDAFDDESEQTGSLVAAHAA